MCEKSNRKGESEGNGKEAVTAEQSIITDYKEVFG